LWRTNAHLLRSGYWLLHAHQKKTHPLPKSLNPASNEAKTDPQKCVQKRFRNRVSSAAVKLPAQLTLQRPVKGMTSETESLLSKHATVRIFDWQLAMTQQAAHIKHDMFVTRL
jgi:hypothetical protein